MSRAVIFAAISTITLAYAQANAASPKTYKQWEACVDRATSSVSLFEVGVLGVEAAIRTNCGRPPVREPTGMTGIVGVHPYDLVRSKNWKSKFQTLTKSKYKLFVDRLVVAGTTVMKGIWVVGDGLAAHSGGSDEAAFAINTETGEVFGAMLEDSTKMSGFGFGTSWQDAPPFIQQWAKEHK